MINEETFKELIESLKVDIRLCEEMIGEVAGDIIREGFSSYPVFIATEHEVKIGERIVDKNDFAAKFNIYASTLEELMDNKLILPERKENFIKAFKNPKQFMCFMLITPEIASVVFLPFTKGIKP
jgi:hypothetical protein